MAIPPIDCREEDGKILMGKDTLKCLLEYIESLQYEIEQLRYGEGESKATGRSPEKAPS